MGGGRCPSGDANDQKLKATAGDELIPDCHSAETVCQQRTARTLFQPYVLTVHVPIKTNARGLYT